MALLVSNKKKILALNVWKSKQVYIAINYLLFAVVDIDIDFILMKGFDDRKVDEILDLKAKGVKYGEPVNNFV